MQAALLPGMNRPSEQRQRSSRERDRLQGEPHEHHVSAHARRIPRLLHGFHVGRIRLRFDLRRKRLEPRGLDDEVGAARHGRVAGAPPADAARKAAIVGAAAQLAHALDQAVALGHRIERGRRTHLERELAAVLDRIDRDHLARAQNAAGLNGAESDRARAEHRDVRPGLEAHVGVAGGKPRRQLIAEQRELRGRQIAEDRHAVLFERGHDLADPADARLRVDAGPVPHFRERRKRLDAGRVREERELTVVRTPLQALIALAALRSARDHHAVARLDALHHRADGFHDAEAAMIRHFRALDRIGAERAADDRVARRHGQGSDHDLARIARQEPQLLDVDCGVVAHERAERPAGLRTRQHGGRLLLCGGRPGREQRAASPQRRRAATQDLSA